MFQIIVKHSYLYLRGPSMILRPTQRFRMRKLWEITFIHYILCCNVYYLFMIILDFKHSPCSECCMLSSG